MNLQTLATGTTIAVVNQILGAMGGASAAVRTEGRGKRTEFRASDDASDDASSTNQLHATVRQMLDRFHIFDIHILEDCEGGL